MGVELDQPILTDETYKLSYTHEGGASGNLRFLKNITGMWLVQELRRAWKAEGDDVDFDTLMKMAQAAKPFVSLIDPDDAPFAAPGNMPGKIAAYCQRTDQPVPQTKGAFIRAAFEGLVLRYREVWSQLESITGVQRGGLNMIGGATKDPLHCQMTADALNIPVTCGPVEGAAMGNVLAQMLASGDIHSIDEGREIVRASTQLDRYEPRDPAPWQGAFARWLAIKARA
jgi:rhamnulokinase